MNSTPDRPLGVSHRSSKDRIPWRGKRYRPVPAADTSLLLASTLARLRSDAKLRAEARRCLVRRIAERAVQIIEEDHRET